MSAFMPALITPVSSPKPIARAPLAVAILKAWRALTSSGSCPIPLCISAARCISSNMFRLLLLAAPSVPNATLTPAFSISGTGEIPLPSFKLLVGLCAAFTSYFLSKPISSSETCTRCAPMTGTSNMPVSAHISTGDFPYCSKLSLRSFAVSSKCM